MKIQFNSSVNGFDAIRILESANEQKEKSVFRFKWLLSMSNYHKCNFIDSINIHPVAPTEFLF